MPDAYPDPAALIAQTTPPRSPNPPDTEPEPTADQDKDEGNYVEFPIPENFQPPEDAKPGKSFQALATLKLDEDGKTLCLVAVDGAAVKPGEEEEPEKPEGEEPEGEEPTTMAGALKQGLPATGMPA
jgi:hypothetical protein